MTLLTGEPLDAVDLRHRRVRAVRYDLTRRAGVPGSMADTTADRTEKKTAVVKTPNKRTAQRQAVADSRRSKDGFPSYFDVPLILLRCCSIQLHFFPERDGRFGHVKRRGTGV